MSNVGGSLELACWTTHEHILRVPHIILLLLGRRRWLLLLLLLLNRSACRLRLRCCCSTQILDTQAQKHATGGEKIPLIRPNRALWTLIKDDASYELTRACGKLCRIPCLESTFAEPKCLYCGLQSTTNSCRQSTTNGDDLRQDRGRLTRGDDAPPLSRSIWSDAFFNEYQFPINIIKYHRL